ncbi:thiamine biosynthesis lipoprotein [Caloramator quimbayensis]|uniref:FAD:protein FMN transferase n=1 Tax=Caloramator quimbayensis TaxID=1147123 RepID=A0A1T4XEP2_9CLOT|nr:FAD:protein FMN transferase [Caloramator quimbayensis]SKA87857.1 thiamine biosynthesis lipoprotein [Caloramator quimbayensis]
MRYNKKKFFIKFIISIIILSLFFSGCGKKVKVLNEPIEKTDFVLGTVCTVKIYDEAPSNLLDKVFDRLKEIENRMTINAEGSEVDEINEKSGIEPVKVTDDVYYVIKTGKEFGKISGGRFDITIGPIVKLWNIGTDYARVPSPDEIKEKLPLVNYEDIVLDDKNKTVFLKRKGMIIDLGGIAKGYAADEVYRILKENNVEHAIINLGGNVFAMGVNPKENRNWNIGVQDPFSERGDYIGILSISDKTVVSSGIYERYFIQDGKRYHHILDTKSGYPVDNNLAGTTIVADKSINGDGLSTTIFAAGVEDGLKIAESLKGVEAIFITKNREVYITPKLKSIFKITNPNFKLMN